MSEPNDETQVGFSPPEETPARAADADATPGVIPAPPGPASGGGTPTPAPQPAGSIPEAPTAADPASAAVSPADPAAPAGSMPPATVPPGTMPPGNSPPLRADPNRPAASAWREPPWFPPRRRSRGPSLATIVVGLVIIAIGLYYLLDVTFGLDLPRITWGALWPVILIIVGGLIVIGAVSRR